MTPQERFQAHLIALQGLRESLNGEDTEGDLLTVADGRILAEALIDVIALAGQLGAAAAAMERHPLLGGLVRQLGAAMDQ